MKSHSLHLMTQPDKWRLFAARRADPAFARFAENVQQRDHHTCQFCGFQAKLFQQVVNLDHNYHNNKPINMITACVFCTQCLFLESAGQGNEGGGTLIYLPEIKQADLNGLCHVLFCAIANATAYRSDAQNIYRSLKLRARIVEEKLGEKTSQPAVLGQMLNEAQTQDHEKMQTEILQHLRLLPSRSKFNKHIEAWASAALDELSMDEDDDDDDED